MTCTSQRRQSALPRRLRECFAITLRETYRNKAIGDITSKERAWKAFGLVPVMLLGRPRGCGSIGKDELALRSDKFARGEWLELLDEARTNTQGNRPRVTKSDSEESGRRGRAAQSRVQRGQVSKARQELTGAAVEPKTAVTLRELQDKRLQEKVKEIR